MVLKIALVCEHGGHLTEMLYLMPAFKNYEVILITNNSIRTRALNCNRYLLDHVRADPFKMIKTSLDFFNIFRKEKIDLIISTGAEIAIPAFFVAKIMKIRTIFIESWCRVYSKSKTGCIVYYFSDYFLVQWPHQVKKYGNKAMYLGSLIE